MSLVELRRGGNVKEKSGGRGTRTPTGLRPAVFKTAAIPLCEPSVAGSHKDKVLWDLISMKCWNASVLRVTLRGVAEPRIGATGLLCAW